MTALSSHRIGHLGFFAFLIVFSYLFVSSAVRLDLTEANNVSKIKFNPRGNLWATGHFMGKKSLLDYPDGYDDTLGRLPLTSPEDPKTIGSLLSRRMLEIALAQEAKEKRERYGSEAQETGLITKFIERYGKTTKK